MRKHAWALVILAICSSLVDCIQRRGSDQVIAMGREPAFIVEVFLRACLWYACRVLSIHLAAPLLATAAICGLVNCLLQSALGLLWFFWEHHALPGSHMLAVPAVLMFDWLVNGAALSAFTDLFRVDGATQPWRMPLWGRAAAATVSAPLAAFLLGRGFRHCAGGTVPGLQAPRPMTLFILLLSVAASIAIFVAGVLDQVTALQDGALLPRPMLGSYLWKAPAARWATRFFLILASLFAAVGTRVLPREPCGGNMTAAAGCGDSPVSFTWRLRCVIFGVLSLCAIELVHEAGGWLKRVRLHATVVAAGASEHRTSHHLPMDKAQ